MRILLLLLSLNVQAGLLDFTDIEQANLAYQQQDYKTAGDKFARIDNDAARLNQANSLYKQNLYQQALEKYQSIKQFDLTFDRLYNAGNAYAKLGKINEAIDSYQQALKLKQDKDALFNLELLKKRKQKSKKNESNKKQNTRKKNKKPQKKSKKSKGKKKKSDKKKGEDKQQQTKKLKAVKQQRLEKSLQKNLRTLLIPLNKQQQNNNENNPW